MTTTTVTEVRERLVFSENKTHSVKLTADGSKVCTGAYAKRHFLFGDGDINDESYQMTFKKATPRTLVYQAEGVAISPLYVQKTAFVGRPHNIVVKITGNVYKSLLLEIAAVARPA